MERRRHRAALRRHVRGRQRRAARAGAPRARARRGRGAGACASWRARRCSPRTSARTRRARCCCRATGRASARRCGRSGCARRTCSRWRCSIPAFPDRARDLPRGAARRVRRAGAGRAAGQDPAARGARGRGRDARARRRSRARSRSPTSPPTCTRATRRWPSARRRRSRSIATSCASCSARRSCASCSSRRRSPTSRPSCRALSPERRARHADAVHDLLRRVGDLDERRSWRRASTADRRARDGGARCVDSGRALQRARGRAGALDRRRGRGASIATRSARRCRPAWPRCSSSRRRRRSRRWWRAGRARTGPSPPTGATSPSGSASCPRRWRRSLRALVADGRLYEGEFRPGGSGAELCDPEVLRLVRRDTLARLRNEVAPVDAAVLGRFLPRWHGVGSARGGSGRLREAIDQLEGLALPFSELERVILPARVPDFQPRMLDELGAAGEVVWVGQGAHRQRRRARASSIAASTWRRCYDVPATPELPSRAARGDPGAPRRARRLVRGAAARRGGAARRGHARRCGICVWLGLVTNDTFAPLRTLGRTDARAARPLSRCRRAGAGRRWRRLVGAPPAETVRAHTRALMLLERYGVVSREAAAAESLAGGFASVSGVLRAMEESGKIRRGHFVDGLQGAQFAHAAAVDRLRAARDADGDAAGPPVVVLSAIDPANPYGALLPWPTEGARRAAGAKVVLVHGAAAFFVERGGKKLRLLARRRRRAAAGGAGGAAGASRPRGAIASCASRRSTACRRCTRRTRRCSSAAASASSPARSSCRRTTDARGRQHPRARAEMLGELVGERLDGVWSKGVEMRGLRGQAMRASRRSASTSSSPSTRAAPCACTSASPAAGDDARAPATATLAAAELALRTAAGAWIAKARTIEWTRARFAAGARALARLGPDLLGARAARSRRRRGPRARSRCTPRARSASCSSIDRSPPASATSTSASSSSCTACIRGARVDSVDDASCARCSPTACACCTPTSAARAPRRRTRRACAPRYYVYGRYAPPLPPLRRGHRARAVSARPCARPTGARAVSPSVGGIVGRVAS